MVQPQLLFLHDCQPRLHHPALLLLPMATWGMGCPGSKATRCDYRHAPLVAHGLGSEILRSIHEGFLNFSCFGRHNAGLATGMVIHTSITL